MEAVSILSFIVAVFSVIFAWRSSLEAKKANDIGRLNSLFAFKEHYLNQLKNLEDKSIFLKESKSAQESIQKEYGEIDLKYRDIKKELEQYHNKVMNP